MSFTDCFKEFHEIGMDGHIRLRQHRPEQDAAAFFRIYSDRDAFRFFDVNLWALTADREA